MPARHALLEIRDGAHFAWRHPLLRPVLLTGVAWNISWFVLQAACVPYAVRSLGLSTQAVGVTLGCYGAGMVGAALGGVIGSLWGEPACLWLALAGFAVQAGFILTSRMNALRRLPAPVV